MCDPFSETPRCVCCVYKNPSQGVDKINTSSVHICDTLSHIHTCNAVKTMNVSFDIISCINTVNILCDIISVNTTLKGALQTNTKNTNMRLSRTPFILFTWQTRTSCIQTLLLFPVRVTKTHPKIHKVTKKENVRFLKTINSTTFKKNAQRTRNGMSFTHLNNVVLLH